MFYSHEGESCVLAMMPRDHTQHTRFQLASPQSVEDKLIILLQSSPTGNMESPRSGTFHAFLDPFT